MPAEERPSADDLSALPAPRRPFRRLTFFVMGLTGVLSTWLAYGLRGEVAYALKAGSPVDLGELSSVRLGDSLENAWVRASATLSSREVIRYFRPLDPDPYRLAKVDGVPRLWIELRVPSDADGDQFIAPGSFVGRLVPVSEAGLRYDALPEAAADSRGADIGGGDWLLIDGESPETTRWALALFAILVGFAGFNLVGLVRLARPVRDA
jgi:hypothetical protein